MNRRHFLTAAALAPLGAAAHPAARPPLRTRWSIRTSEGFDAYCFLQPLSGKPFYTRYYEAELAAFRPRLPAAALDALAGLHAESDAAGALLGPDLCTLSSGGPDATLADAIGAVERAETELLPPLKAGSYWDADGWARFLNGRERLLTVLRAMEAAGFADFRKRCIGVREAVRLPALGAKVAGLDIIAEQERLLGRRLAPALEVILMWFSKPHGIRIQGQRFLTHMDYPDDIVLRNAAHEILHPPFSMDGPTARAALAVLGRDPLLTRIVAEHDPAFGYNSLEGLLNEDMVQALEQIVSERLGFADPARARWLEADDGMHVLAAGLYGLLKADGYDRSGGNIARWTRAAAATGKLSPPRLHGAAAQVLGVPQDRLWTVRPRPDGTAPSGGLGGGPRGGGAVGHGLQQVDDSPPDMGVGDRGVYGQHLHGAGDRQLFEHRVVRRRGRALPHQAGAGRLKRRGDLRQHRGGHAIGAALILLHLLEGDPDGLGQGRLADLQRLAAQTDTGAYRHIDRIWNVCHRPLSFFLLGRRPQVATPTDNRPTRLPCSKAPLRTHVWDVSGLKRKLVRAGAAKRRICPY
jgi:hypothetical protein